MRSVFKYVEAIAKTSLPVMITGESGSGKELIAKAVHDASGRKGAFVAVNVAGLDDNLFSDTLFGHEKGAFTGADAKRSGLIGKAAGGTLFLDEIGDLKMESQVKLLRLLEERMYYPIGSDTPLTTDTRVVVATNCDVLTKQKKGEFRSDLYYRLAGHQVKIPPLRNRREDLPPLTKFFLKKAALDMGKTVPTAPKELYQLFGTYNFPGNIRELRGMVYDAVSQHVSGVLSLDSFKLYIANQTGDTPVFEHLQSPSGAESVHNDGGVPVVFGERLPSLREIEELLVTEAMKRAGGNQSVASTFLGITRSALNKRLNK